MYILSFLFHVAFVHVTVFKLKRERLISFNKYIHLSNPDCYQDTEHFHRPRKWSHALSK